MFFGKNMDGIYPGENKRDSEIKNQTVFIDILFPEEIDQAEKQQKARKPDEKE